MKNERRRTGQGLASGGRSQRFPKERWSQQLSIADRASTKNRARPGHVGVGREQRGFVKLMVTLLIGLGASLLVLGSLVAFPYVRSRLWNQPAPAAVLERLGGPMLRIGTDAPAAASPAVCRDESCLTREASRDLAASVRDVSSRPALPTRLRIPKLGLDAPIVPVGWSTAWVYGREVGVWEVPGGGAVGWHQGTAPLGEVGNTVLNGHNTTGGEVFRDLYRLQAGDTLTIYSGLEPHTYAVSATLMLPEAGQPWDLRLRNASLLEHTLDERVTLVTCHPYGSVRNRLLVIALPTATKAGGLNSPGE